MKTFFKRSRSDRELKRLLRKNAAEGKPLSIMDDAVFKAMLSADNDDSREALRSLLSACTRRKVATVQITRNDLVPAHMEAKSARLDVNVTFNDGEAANLEMQMKKSEDNLKDRAAFYTAMLQTSQPGRGRRYREIKRVYQIFFLNCELFPDSEKLSRRYSYREEEEHDRLTEATEIIFYELPKLEKKMQKILAGTIDMSLLPEDEKWCMYMKYRHEEQTSELIEQLCQKEEGIMRAERATYWVSRDYEKAIRRMNIIKNEMDLNERSYNEGQTEKALEIARKMKGKGLPVGEIADITGLSFETIEQM
jgi:predicted transposase/invertase (TIGR01784 family)